MVFVKLLGDIAVKQAKFLWDTSVGLCLMQKFPLHITHFLSNRFRDPSLIDDMKQFPGSP